MSDYNLFLPTIQFPLVFAGLESRLPVHYNVFNTELVMTSFLQFFAVPVLGPWVLKLSVTGPSLGLSKKGKKTKTGLDL